MSEAESVFVEAPARLHLGVLDLRGDYGRRFGGLGAALEAPSLLLEAGRARELSAHGEEAERVLACARRVLQAQGIQEGARLRVHRALPAHAGLGSGTQLALATARALAGLFGGPTDAASLAVATGRARRSSIGTWAFQQGGFLLEGGRRDDGDGPAPLLLRRALPTSWRCVLVLPDLPRGLSGRDEAQAFRALPPPPAELVGRIAHLVLMVVLPALVEEDLEAFGFGLTEVQRLVGETFLRAQGGTFAHDLVAELIVALREAGAAGAGQSSWGPAVWGLAADEQDARRLAARLEERLAGRGTVHVAAFRNAGARAWSATSALASV